MPKSMTNTLRGHSPLAPSKAVAAMPNPIVCLVVAIAIVGLASDRPAGATEMLRCARFGQGELPAPVPSPYPSAIERADRISHAVKSAPYSVLFFGDSLTEGWDTTVWEDYLAPRGVLNAGVSGDRTDNLLWRLEHGNLAGPQPKAVVLLIGTNDLAYGRARRLERPTASAPISKCSASISQRHASCFSACCRAKPCQARRFGSRWRRSTG
jgi:hypothetical protein